MKDDFNLEEAKASIIQTNEVFRTEYKQCKTYGDFGRLVERLTIPYMRQLRDAMQLVQDTTGLTMREDAFLVVLNCFIKYRVEGG